MAHGKTSSNPNAFILPDLGEGVHEAELIAWRVEVGQSVQEHDILAEMETDKALVEVPAPRAGTIAELHGEPGEILKVGNPLVTFAGEGGQSSSPASKAAAAEPAPQASSQAPAESTSEEEEREDAGTVVGNMSATPGFSAEPGKALATPAVRRLARDLGVDINAINGSGIGGRVTDKDVRAAAESGGAAQAPAARSAPARREPQPAPSRDAPAPAPAPSRSTEAPAPRREPAIPEGQDTQRIPFRGVRRTIANRLRESVNQAVHFNVMDEADVTQLDALRKRLAAASGEKVSFLPFVCAAVCRVLADERFASLNATVDDQNEEIVRHRAVHLGIATDTDSGLMVPVIHDCDRLGVLEIGRNVTRVASAARDRSIARDELSGSTFTISNVGSHAGRFATPIINYPEVGILAAGRVREGMVVSGGAFRVGKLLPLSLACDHRVVDGATAALALARVIELLQSPDDLLTPART